jgi:copper chaperone NosL
MKGRSFYNQNRIAYSVIRKTIGHTQNGIRYKRFALSILLSALLLLGFTACGGRANAEPTPPTIHYGEDICELCGMIISEDRFAAAYVTTDGHDHIFDDIGDMVQAHPEKQEEVMVFFVHDYENQNWIRAETAHYILSDNLPTPMLSGLAAFSSAEKAKAFATEIDGQVLTFDELLTHYRENPPVSGAHHHTGH